MSSSSSSVLQVTTCVDILCKYLDNIIANPDNPKVRKIRFANKAYQEKVAPVEGATLFLQAAGFRRAQVKNDETGTDEDVWLFSPGESGLEESISLMTVSNFQLNSNLVKVFRHV